MTRQRSELARHKTSAPLRYRASRFLMAVLAASFVLFSTIAFAQTTLGHVWQAVFERAGAFPQSDYVPVAVVAIGPVAAAAGAYVLSGALIHVLRIALYAGKLHRYCATYLRLTAPLHRSKIAPPIALYDTENRRQRAPVRKPTVALAAYRRTILIGAPGAGKTVSLYSAAYIRTRLLAMPALCLGRAPIPILLDAREIPHCEDPGEDSIQPALRHALERFGSASLAMRLTTIQCRQGALVLCDGTDDLTDQQCRLLVNDLEALVEQAPKSSVIVTWRSTPGVVDPEIPDEFTGFARAVVGDLSDRDIHTALRSTTVPRATKRPASADLIETLERYRLAATAHTPSALGALMRVWASGAPLPYGRGELYLRWIDLIISSVDTLSTPSGGCVRFLAALASALRRSGQRLIPIPAGTPVGDALAAWIADNRPLALAAGDPVTLVTDRVGMDEIYRIAISQGILVRAPTDSHVAFVNSDVEAAFAAWWLRDNDSNSDAMPYELLRIEWVLPILLWSGSASSPYEVARRARGLGLPDQTFGADAETTNVQDLEAFARALALAVVIEGMSTQIGRCKAPPDAPDDALDLIEQYLRDLLDDTLTTSGAHDEQCRLSNALRVIDGVGGGELAISIAYLVKETRFGGLTRAQLVMLLGLLATPAAARILTDLLDEPDPVVRQAMRTAVPLAADVMVTPLCAALSTSQQRVMDRTVEALTWLGDFAVAPALALLDSRDAEVRVAAIRILRNLAAGQSEEVLIAHLDDSALDVRVASAQALGAVASARAAAALAAHAGSRDVSMRVAVASALGQIRDAESIAPLEILLDDTEPAVRVAAAAALGLLGDDRAVEALGNHRQHADALTRSAVATALRRLGRPH